MRRATRPAPRAAFTLIELLVVISIMAILAAIVAGGIGMVRTAQMGTVTDQTLSKLQMGLDNQWRVVMEEVRSPGRVPPDVVAFCDGDADRAQALWAYINAKLNFPQTFQEALNGVPFAGQTRRPVFAKLPNVPLPTNDIEARDQSAALLYLILTESGRKGVEFRADDVTQNAQGEVTIGGQTFRVFRDAWGTPIGFVRHYGANVPELQQPPYVEAQRVGQNADPFDPFKSVMGQPKGKLADNWSGKTAALAGLNLNAGRSTLPVPPGFDGTNKVITVVSVGPDKDDQFATPGDTDDRFGYKLRRQGNKGD